MSKVASLQFNVRCKYTAIFKHLALYYKHRSEKVTRIEPDHGKEEGSAILRSSPGYTVYTV